MPRPNYSVIDESTRIASVFIETTMYDRTLFALSSVILFYKHTCAEMVNLRKIFIDRITYLGSSWDEKSGAVHSVRINWVTSLLFLHYAISDDDDTPKKGCESVIIIAFFRIGDGDKGKRIEIKMKEKKTSIQSIGKISIVTRGRCSL